MTVDELSAQVAEQAEELATLRAQLAAKDAKDGISEQLVELMQVLRDQRGPDVNITVPSAPVAPISVQAPASTSGDWEVLEATPSYYPGSNLLKSLSITRRRKDQA